MWADKIFQIAIDVLSAYEGKHHPYLMESSVAKMMEVARIKDKSSLTTSKRLKKIFSVVSENFHLRFLPY